LTKPERQLVWDGCVNVRDLGGLATEDGGETSFRAVVRADNVCRLGEAGWRALADYGIRRIVDLRHQGEVDADPPHMDGVDVLHAPLVEDPASFRDLDDLLVRIREPAAWRRANYLTLLEWFPQNFARAVRAVAQANDGTVLVHCAGGVDRTGLVSAFLLRLAGVSVQTVAEDYAASEANWSPFVGRWIAEAPDDVEREKRRLLSVMPAAVMHDVLVELEERHGSVRGYLLHGGALDDDLERVRSRLLAS
jgi:protein tyrosine/serine phosphatase